MLPNIPEEACNRVLVFLVYSLPSTPPTRLILF
jgi:hypothetical protein